MAYFTSYKEMVDYEQGVCQQCLHQPKFQHFCPVLRAHYYALQHDLPMSALDYLIPEIDDGLGLKGECTMFYEVEQ